MRMGSAVALGAVLLTGCSGGDAAYQDFCDTSDTLTSMGSEVGALVPDQATLASAGAGDLTALNEWGTQAQETVTGIGEQFQDAMDNAPDEDIAAALGTYLEMLDLFQQMAIAGAETDDAAEFTATLEDLNTKGAALTEDMNDAGQVLSEAAQAHCS